MDDFELLRKYGLSGYRVTDAASVAEGEAAKIIDKARGMIDQFDERAAAIRSNTYLSREGKAGTVRELGLTMLNDLDKMKNTFFVPFIAHRDKLIADRTLKQPEGDPVVRELRAVEVRGFLRKGTVPTAASLLDAAEKGDVDTVNAILNAPAGMLPVDKSTRDIALNILADKRDPEGAAAIKRLTEIVDKVERMLAAAIDHISTESGVADPDAELRRVAETGEVPDHLNVTAARPSRV